VNPAPQIAIQQEKRNQRAPGIYVCFVRTTCIACSVETCWKDGVFIDTKINFPVRRVAAFLGLTQRGDLSGVWVPDVNGNIEHGFVCPKTAPCFSYDAPVPGTFFTDGKEINAHGQIVGIYLAAADPNFWHSYLMSGATFTKIDFPGSTGTGAFGINSAGQIVGKYFGADGNTYAPSPPQSSTASIAQPAFFLHNPQYGSRRFSPRGQCWRAQDISPKHRCTFVVRKLGSRAKFRAALLRKLPFEAEVLMCDGRDLIRLETENPFAAEPSPPDVVRFVSILSKVDGVWASLPVAFPSDGAWLVQVMASEGQFVFGMYRRHMKTIGYLGQIDKLYGVRRRYGIGTQ
jgi:hypothetical protein